MQNMTCGFITDDFESDEEDYIEEEEDYDDDETANQTYFTNDGATVDPTTTGKAGDAALLMKGGGGGGAGAGGGITVGRYRGGKGGEGDVRRRSNKERGIHNTNNATNSTKNKMDQSRDRWSRVGPQQSAGGNTVSSTTAGGSRSIGDTMYDLTTVATPINPNPNPTTTTTPPSMNIARNNNVTVAGGPGGATVGPNGTGGGGTGGSSGDVLNTSYENATPLFKNIEKENWNGIVQFLKTGKWNTSFFGDVHILTSSYEHLKSPAPYIQARTWVTFYDTKTREPEWSQLPLHAAISYKAPFVVVQKLVEIFPKAVQCTDREGMLPIHLAFGFDSPDNTISLLLEAFPASLDERCGVGSRLPYECCELGKNRIRGKVFSIFAEQISLKVKDECDSQWKQFAKAAMNRLQIEPTPIKNNNHNKSKTPNGGDRSSDSNDEYNDEDRMEHYFKNKPLTEFLLELLEDRKELMDLKQKLTDRLVKSKSSSPLHSNHNSNNNNNNNNNKNNNKSNKRNHHKQTIGATIIHPYGKEQQSSLIVIPADPVGTKVTTTTSSTPRKHRSSSVPPPSPGVKPPLSATTAGKRGGGGTGGINVPHQSKYQNLSSPMLSNNNSNVIVASPKKIAVVDPVAVVVPKSRSVFRTASFGRIRNNSNSNNDPIADTPTAVKSLSTKHSTSTPITNNNHTNNNHHLSNKTKVALEGKGGGSGGVLELPAQQQQQQQQQQKQRVKRRSGNGGNAIETNPEQIMTTTKTSKKKHF